MELEEIIKAAVQELTELALRNRREAFSEEEKAHSGELLELSEKTKKILSRLPVQERQVVEDYMTAIHLTAQEECEYLYVQGAKDCVRLLKKLGVL